MDQMLHSLWPIHEKELVLPWVSQDFVKTSTATTHPSCVCLQWEPLECQPLTVQSFYDVMITEAQAAKNIRTPMSHTNWKSLFLNLSLRNKGQRIQLKISSYTFISPLPFSPILLPHSLRASHSSPNLLFSLLPNPKRHFPFTSHLSLSEFLILDLLSLYFKSFFSSYELLSFLHHSLLLHLRERFTPKEAHWPVARESSLSICSRILGVGKGQSGHVVTR